MSMATTNNPKKPEWFVVEGSGGSNPTALKPYSPEWFLFNYLEAWDKTDLASAIKNDVRPDLSGFSDLILDQTTEFFFKLFKTHRPDLWEAINTKDGKQWLKEIIKSAMMLKA